MMTDERRREIHKRIKEMKKERDNPDDFTPKSYSSTYSSSYERSDESRFPLFRKDLFLLKVLGSALLFAGVALMYKYPVEKLDTAREVVASTFEKEMQFAFVKEWYEDTFGKPIAFLPSDQKLGKGETELVNSSYAIPISASISEDFKQNGDGIILESDKNVAVGAIDKGLVLFAGKKEKTGNTIVIQHADQSESWYGNLKSLNVKEYDEVKKGQKIGIVSDGKEEGKGTMFFALKKNEVFVDPSQVIPFE
ncbi:peptidoglycan DD-metalloendopeptidase family protein [Bacillus sp. 1P06AnD]|uniref:peptidoglycan DD-metalloendopeptidase family protein n=1 Tax=Bacillus sp. 1P06AnD TaxID=3132208 RepID=UPI0039A1627F